MAYTIAAIVCLICILAIVFGIRVYKENSKIISKEKELKKQEQEEIKLLRKKDF